MMSISTVERAIAFLGGPSSVARLCELKSPWAVSKWINEGLPNDRVLWVAEQTGWRFTPHQLKPSIYPHPDDGLPERLRSHSKIRTKPAPPPDQAVA